MANPTSLSTTPVDVAALRAEIDRLAAGDGLDQFRARCLAITHGALLLRHQQSRSR